MYPDAVMDAGEHTASRLHGSCSLPPPHAAAPTSAPSHRRCSSRPLSRPTRTRKPPTRPSPGASHGPRRPPRTWAGSIGWPLQATAPTRTPHHPGTARHRHPAHLQTRHRNRGYKGAPAHAPTHDTTVPVSSASWPMKGPMALLGMLCGHDTLNSSASGPAVRGGYAGRAAGECSTVTARAQT